MCSLRYTRFLDPLKGTRCKDIHYKKDNCDNFNFLTGLQFFILSFIFIGLKKLNENISKYHLVTMAG